MPKLFNAESAAFKTFAVASMASNASASAAWTGVTTDDYAIVFNGTAAIAPGAYISTADTVKFQPKTGTVGKQSTVAQTIGILLHKAPTSGADGGGW